MKFYCTHSLEHVDESSEMTFVNMTDMTEINTVNDSSHASHVYLHMMLNETVHLV